MLNENIRNSSLTVGTSLVEVSPAVTTGQVSVRVYTNTSTAGQIITLAWNTNATSGQGIVLYPGGSWSESVDSSFIPSNSRVSGIASAASGTLSIHERIKE